EVVPYIEKVTQPGTSVVFLIHHPVNSFKWLQAYCGVMGCGLERTVAIRRMVESYSVKMRTQLAQQKVFHTCEALHKLGVQGGRGDLHRELEGNAAALCAWRRRGPYRYAARDWTPNHEFLAGYGLYS